LRHQLMWVHVVVVLMYAAECQIFDAAFATVVVCYHLYHTYERQTPNYFLTYE
jgi:hypothetical protein